MAERQVRNLNHRTVEALAADGRDTVFWDRDLAGFGVRVYPSGRKVYVVQSRGPAGSRRVTLGLHGSLSAGRARQDAAAAIDRIKRGEDPVPAPPPEPEPEPTVGDLADRFMREHAAVNCKPSTVGHYRWVLDKYILPALRGLVVGAVERGHVAGLHYELRGRPFVANRALATLTKMFSLAEAWGLRKKGSNPCRFVRRYSERRRERFLTREEYRRLGAVLDEAQADGMVFASAVAAIRLLMLTGCRRNEIVTLRWDDVDRTAGELRLRDSKTGARMVPLSPTAAAVLDAIPCEGGNPWVIAGKKPGARLCGINDQWRRLRERADLEDVRLHDLRHSYASRALALGESLSMIGTLLGHSQVETTARYAHLARDTEKVSAARVAGSIGAEIMPEDAEAA